MLPHLAARLFGTPLLVQRAKLDVILAVLCERLHLAAPEVELAPPRPRPAHLTGTPKRSIAVIPIHGTLVKRTLGLEAASGLTSYADVGARLEAALGDPLVAGIVLDIDSPGGETGGCFELARRVREAASVKPVWAVANDAAFSAAYAIGCAAERLFVTETGGVGSIGVIALHVDQSVKDAKDGFSYTAVFAGSHKNDFSPHAPLSPQAATALQAEVDRLYDIFVNQVGQMRGLDPDAVRATEAAVFYGEHAVTAGLADAVMPFDAVMTEFADALAAKQRLAQPGVARASKRSLSAQPISSPPASKPPNLENTMTDLQNDHDNPNDPTDTDPQGDPPPTDSDPHPAPAARAALAQSFASGRSQAQAIAELCLIAGQPHRAAEFIAAGLTEAQVRRALLEARADQPEISSRITAEAGTTLRPQDSPVVAAVKKLTAKE